MNWKIKIWDYDQWLERTIEAATKEAAANEFCGKYPWMESRKKEVIDNLRPAICS